MIKKSIVIIYPLFYFSGGAETYIRNVAHEYISQGHEVTIITSQYHDTHKVLSGYHKKIRFIFIPPFYEPQIAYKFYGIRRFLLMEIFFYYFIARAGSALSQYIKIDHVVLLFGYPSNLVFAVYKMLFGRKNKYIWHCLELYGSDARFYPAPSILKKPIPFLFKLYYLTFGFIHRFIDQIMVRIYIDNLAALSTFMKKQIDKQYSLRTEVIPGGIDFSEYRMTQEIKKKSHLLKKKLKAGDKTILLCVGNYTEHKNFRFLVRLMNFIINVKKDKEYFLVIAGKPHNLFEFEYINRYIKNHRLEKYVVLTGALKDRDLKTYYTLCDLFVYPSDRETFGLVILEALAFNKKVVAINKGGVVDILKGGKGILTELNYARFYQAIKQSKGMDFEVNKAELARKFAWRCIAMLLLREAKY